MQPKILNKTESPCTHKRKIETTTVNQCETIEPRKKKHTYSCNNQKKIYIVLFIPEFLKILKVLPKKREKETHWEQDDKKAFTSVMILKDRATIRLKSRTNTHSLHKEYGDFRTHYPSAATESGG